VIRVILLSIFLAAATGCFGRASEVHRGGPLACPECAREGVSMPIDTGKPLTHGILLLRNRGTKAARVTAVHLDGRRGPIEVIGTLASPVGPHGVAAIMPGFPPRGWVLPDARRAVGYVIEPGRVVEVLIGLRLMQSGVAGYHAITIDYVVDGSRYRATFNEQMAACSPRAKYAHCVTPPEIS
jgi:hypothetical protein